MSGCGGADGKSFVHYVDDYLATHILLDIEVLNYRIELLKCYGQRPACCGAT
jgi:hypothetical protein